MLHRPDGRVLTIEHRALSKWLLPGGHIEETDETLVGAALRELAEETGIDADNVTLTVDLPLHVDAHIIPANPAKDEPEHLHLGVGKIVDIGVHQLILDTPVYFALCDSYNDGRYKHHAPFIERRSDGLCLRTADFLRSNGFDIDDELWAIDGANCSPCDSKVPDSH